MEIDLFAVVPFALITIFTPGPNNISSASMGILYGFRRTLSYLMGIAAGFFLVLLLCGWISSALLRVLPAFESGLRVAGALYILWLAYHTLKASYTFSADQQVLLAFPKGFFLQLLNPKAIVFGLTLYSTFLKGIGARPLLLVVSALLLAIVSFSAVSSWALFGASIRRYLKRPRITQAVNVALSLFLVYTAGEISGLLAFLR